MAIAVIVLHAFRVLDQLRRLPEEICGTPAVMQRFNLKILVVNFPTDRRQLLTQDLDFVEPPVPRRIQIQSTGRLKQLRSWICRFGERFRLLQRRSCFTCLRPFMEGERGAECQLSVKLESCPQFRVGDALRFRERRGKIGHRLCKRQALTRLLEWKQNAVAVIGRALAAQQTMRLLRHTLGNRSQQPGLAHPSLAHHERHMPVAASRVASNHTKMSALAHVR